MASMTQATDDFRESDHPRASNGQFGSGGASTKEPAGAHVDTDEDIVATGHDGKSYTYDLAYHQDGDAVRGHVHNVRGEDGYDGFEGMDRVQAYKLGKALSKHAEAHVDAHVAEMNETERFSSLSEAHQEAEVAAAKAEAATKEVAHTNTVEGAVEAMVARGWTLEQGRFHQQPELKGYASPASHRKIKDALRAKGFAVDEAMTKRRAPRRDRFALDRSPSVRRFDPDSGHLHVSRTPISKANVCPYNGREIPGWRDLGLDAERVYRLYRDPAELEKAAPTVNGKPLLVEHRVSSADDHPHRQTAGSVGNAVWDPPYLYGGLDVWTRDAIDGIESGDRQELSPGYAYEPDMTPGITPSGEKYDGVMRNIRFNHVSLVPEGRTGRDVYVHDTALTHCPRLKDMLMAAKAVPSRTAAVASSALSGALHGALLTYARPRLAKDAQIDVRSLLRGVTVKNAKTKAPTIARAFDAAMKTKLAKDAEVEQEDVQAIVEQVGEMIAENAPDIAAAVEPDPDVTATDEDDADLRALLKAKGLTDDQIDAICEGKMPPPPPPAEDEEGKAAKEAVKGMDAKIAAAVRKAKDEARSGMVEQTAMDNAIAVAVDGAVAAERQRNKDIREAEAHIASSSVGKLKGFGAYDSAPEAWRAGLDALGVKDADKLHDSALRSVFDAHAGLKAAQAAPRRQAQDAAPTGVAYDTTTFPHSGRLK